MTKIFPHSFSRMEKDLTSKALKLIFSRLRMKLENFFCFTSNFKLEQKVTVERKVFQETLAKTECVQDSLSPLTDNYNSGSPTMSDKKNSNKDPLSESQ